MRRTPSSKNKGTGSKTVLITGAASGLGLAYTRQFQAQGDTVIATDLYPEPGEELCAFGVSVRYRKLDVTSEADWQQAAAELGAVDVLILNAGIAVGGSVETVPIETWQRTLDINLLGAVRGVRAFAPHMRRGGRIVLTASIAGLIHPTTMATYNASKAALVALGETLDAELRPRGISTTVVCPQFFRSNLAASLSGDDENADTLARTILSRTPLTADTVARRAIRGIERRRLVVTPDVVAVLGWYSKRWLRPVHLAVMRGAGRLHNWRQTRHRGAAH